MNASHHADILVAGHSLETALSAALLARRGMKVLWLGQPPAAFDTWEGTSLATAPGLLPPPEQLPMLREALKELALDLDVFRRVEASELALLGPRIRLRFPEDAARVPQAKESFAKWEQFVRPNSNKPPRPFAFNKAAQRNLDREQAELKERRPQIPEGELAELYAGAALSAGSGALSSLAAAAQTCAPWVLDGGKPWLVERLHRRFIELGGRVLPSALNNPVQELRVELRALRLTLSNGDEVSAPALLLGLTQPHLESTFHKVSGWFSKKTATGLASLPPSPGLLQARFVVANAGLPDALERLSVVSEFRKGFGSALGSAVGAEDSEFSQSSKGSQLSELPEGAESSKRPKRSEKTGKSGNTGNSQDNNSLDTKHVVLLERRDLSESQSEIRAYRQRSSSQASTSDGSVSEAEKRELKAALGSVLPFFEQHILSENFSHLPFEGASKELPSRISRIHLALPGVAGLDGWEGAAQVGLATADKLTVVKKPRGG